MKNISIVCLRKELLIDQVGQIDITSEWMHTPEVLIQLISEFVIGISGTLINEKNDCKQKVFSW